MDAKANKEAKKMKEAGGGSGARSKHRDGNREKKNDGGASILRAASKINFTNAEDANEWDAKYKQKLTKRPGNQILHTLAKREGDTESWSSEKVKEFLDWVLNRYHNLLKERDSEYGSQDGPMPLHTALLRGNACFVKAVLNNKELINLNDVLPQYFSSRNTLHVAITSENRSIELIELLIEKCALLKLDKMFTAPGGGGGQDATTKNTPLHDCMAMDRKEEDLEEDEESSSSESEEDISDEDADTATEDGAAGEHTMKSPIRATKEHDWENVKSPLSARSLASSKHPFSGIRRANTIMIPGSAKERNEMLRVVKLLIDKHYPALMVTNDNDTTKEARTPYQERLYQLRLMHADKDEEGILREIAKDEVANYIREYCIRNLPRDEIMKCLYHRGQERHIEFDLGGLPHSNISMDYLERLSKHLRFERILKYVALPKLTMDPETTVRRKSRFQQEKKVVHRRGLSDLVEVFKWLRRHNVEQIVKVMVIDDGDPSHAEAAIEEALRDFKVEVWDWKKLDLCSDVIAESSKCVKEVSLYSSGSKAVLMGWASEEGLRNKAKFPELEQVNLFIREGLEDADRLKRDISEFSARLTFGTNIRVRPILDNRLVSYASEFKSSESSSQSENAWIECVSNFSRFLRRAPHAQDKDMPIKIAVIDDGVDGSLLSLDDKIVTGKSFCPYANSTDLMSPYYVSSGNHGTCMATLICKLCPEVSLYVARLDERPGAGGSTRQITTKSAAEAIQWATDCDVDIISMSWTIEAAVQGNDEMLALKNAVDAARAKNILMFCSTSDQGSSTKDDCYPGDFDGCIKIGGATTTGEPLAWVNTDKVQFLLPGNNVPFSNNEGKVVSYESGSSVATAAASGLAGLLLFCGRLVDKAGIQAYRVKAGKDRYVQETLKDTKNMIRMLDKMCISRTKFIAVQETLEDRFNQALNHRRGSLSAAANDQSFNLRQKVRASDLSKMEWDDGQCMEALQFMLSVVNLS
ncbi:hypothetical protein QBC34DRAFT_493784 [Podospora aff. communis PSN243]|uniref:Peptidase S8/S53 domain-containing protein n=1 Tax=Podospora aff. communis PSN243 TaxID=3040156 RepID=A0AAV9GSI4_9PEZI|nr:hypothetical protein QBC34DRAFT_493784 [Podospora aff. communis PSN243]